MTSDLCFRIGMVAAISLLATVVALAAQRWLGDSWATITIGPLIAVAAVILYSRAGRI